MKTSMRLVTLAAGLILLLSYGCKKETPYFPSKATLADYYGEWAGDLTAFKDNHLITVESTLSLYYTDGGTRMGGLLSMDKIYALEEIQLREGIYYFQVLNPDTANPYCANWNLSGYATLKSDSLMHIIISGKECGELGEEWVTWEGDLTLTSAAADSSAYFTFAGVNRLWEYSILTASVDSCEQTTLIDSVTGEVYLGTESTTCQFPWSSRTLRWKITPFHFSVLSPTTSKVVQYAFHLDQTLNKPYYYYYGSDTTVVTLLGEDSVYTPAGGFYCSRFSLERWVHQDSTYRIDKGHIWISNQYGIIRYQSTYVNEPDDIVLQELTGKNF